MIILRILVFNIIFMWCNIEQVNWNISISWDCWNVTIGQIGDQMDNARNYDIKWDVTEDINAVSQYVKISGNILSNREVKTVSGDIELSGDNLGSIKTVSGDIEVLWNNFWEIETVSGDVEVGSNSDEVETTSWDIEIQWDNEGSIESTSGDVEASVNSWSVETDSGRVKLEENTWEISTKSGRVMVGNNFTTRLRGINIWGSIISGSNNVVINNSGWRNVSIINGEVFIDWVKQDDEWGISEKVLELGELDIDVNNRKISKDNEEISLSEAEWYWYDISTDFSEFIYEWQKVNLTSNWIKVTQE
jgi:DUF4097 and DUF4098 domain-containing protein YvlB